jgi:hypothetical protein
MFRVESKPIILICLLILFIKPIVKKVITNRLYFSD